MNIAIQNSIVFMAKKTEEDPVAFFPFIIGIVVITLIIIALCSFSILRAKMGKFESVKDATIMASDFSDAKIGVIFTSPFRKFGAISINQGIILLNKKTVQYYSIYNKKGLTKLQSNIVDIAFGGLAKFIMDEKFGQREFLLFLKLNNGKRVLIRSNECRFTDYVVSKCSRGKITKDDEKWIHRLK